MTEATQRFGKGWRRFSRPTAVLTAHDASEVVPLLAEVESAAARGLFAVGFVAYEASSAFDRALVTQRPATPLARFALFETCVEVDDLPEVPPLPPLDWAPEVDEATYAQRVRQIREFIAAGDTYQVNFTLRLRAADSGIDPYALFRQMNSCRRTGYAFFWQDEDLAIAGASPECFFELDGSTILSRPMKGTAPRGRTTSEDTEIAARLAASEKDRAENLMILDMVRNDLGRIATVGSVRTEDVFHIERYATVHQMTSTARAETQASLAEIFAALFPAASMTGAPKARTMEIIRDLEASPRSVYSGCMGVVGPGRRASFGVAIRTAVLDRTKDEWTYGVGGGIVWDSTPEAEAAEWRTKAAIVLQPPQPDFSLLSTTRWTPEDGYFLLERHLERLADSARYYDWNISLDRVRSALEDYAARLTGPRRIRLTVDRRGAIEIEDFVLPVWPDFPRVALAPEPVESSFPQLFHKLDRRALYDQMRASRPDVDEVILFNEAGEITEGTYSNVLVRVGENMWTTPISCGLVPGVYRAELLAKGEVRERVIGVEELATADEIRLINSVRGMSPPVVIL